MNRIRMNHGEYKDSLHIWNKASDQVSSCGRENQTIPHIVKKCEETAYSGEIDFLKLPQKALDWTDALDVNI